MVVQTFREAFDSALALLVSNANGLGVPADNIKQGEPGIELPNQPPFIYLFCLPGATVQTNLGVPGGSAIAELTIFCGVELQDTQAEALKRAIETAARVVKLLAANGYTLPSDPIDLPSRGARFTEAAVTAQTLYQPWEDLLT